MDILKKADQFCEEKLSFSEKAFVTPTNAKLVSFQYDNHPLYVQTPVLNCPLGFRPFDSNSEKHTLLVNVDEDMIQLMDKMDLAVMNSIMIHSPVWFNKTFSSPELLRELFVSTVKYKQNYLPNMTVRIRFKNDSAMFGVFGTNKNEIPICNANDLMAILPRKTNVRLMLNATSIWFIGGRCGYSWDCIQMHVQDSFVLNNIHSFMFDDDETKEEEQV